MFTIDVRSYGSAVRGWSLALQILSVALLAAVRSSAIEYPYSMVPGGLPADHVLGHDQCLYLGMRFGGQMVWTDRCVWLRAGEKMAGTRRARCGNPTASHLPPGAKTLPPGLHFLVHLMEKPLPNIAPPPQTTVMELTWAPPSQQTQVPELLPPSEQTVVHEFPAPYFFIPAGGGLPPSRCKHKPCNNGASPGVARAPEPSSITLLLSGLIGLGVLIDLNYSRRGKPAPSLSRLTGRGFL